MPAIAYDLTVLDLSKRKMTVAAVSPKTGISGGIVRKMRMSNGRIIREKANTLKGDAKSSRRAKHSEVGLIH